MAEGWREEQHWHDDSVLELMVVSFLHNCPFDLCLPSDMAEGWREEQHWHDDSVLELMVVSFLHNCPFDLCLPQDCPKPEPQDLEVHRCVTSFTNYVIRIRVKQCRHVGFIVKMASSSPGNISQKISLPAERGLIEHNAYTVFNSLVPACTTTSLFYDHANRILCTRELMGYQPLSGAVLSGEFSEDCARALGTTLASLHSTNHVHSGEGRPTLQQLIQQFPARESMLALIRTYHFERPFDLTDPGRRCHQSVMDMLPEILNNTAVTSAKEHAKNSFMNDLECFIHGDLHIESVLINGCDVKVVDTEFARVGPCAYDMGLLLATLLAVYHRYRHVIQNSQLSQHCATGLPDTVASDRHSSDLNRDASSADSMVAFTGGQLLVEEQDQLSEDVEQVSKDCELLCEEHELLSEEHEPITKCAPSDKHHSFYKSTRIAVMSTSGKHVEHEVHELRSQSNPSEEDSEPCDNDACGEFNKEHERERFDEHKQCSNFNSKSHEEETNPCNVYDRNFINTHEKSCFDEKERCSDSNSPEKIHNRYANCEDDTILSEVPHCDDKRLHLTRSKPEDLVLQTCASPAQDGLENSENVCAEIEGTSQVSDGEEEAKERNITTTHTDDVSNDMEYLLAGDILLNCVVLLKEYTTKMFESRQHISEDSETFQRTLLQNIATFTGCELLAWTIGPPHMDFMDTCPAAQVDCVLTAVHLLNYRHGINTVDDFVHLLVNTSYHC